MFFSRAAWVRAFAEEVPFCWAPSLQTCQGLEQIVSRQMKTMLQAMLCEPPATVTLMDTLALLPSRARQDVLNSEEEIEAGAGGGGDGQWHFLFPQQSFLRMLRSPSGGAAGRRRFEPDALLCLQVLFEKRVRRLLRALGVILDTQKRTRVVERDVTALAEVVRHLMTEVDS